MSIRLNDKLIRNSLKAFLAQKDSTAVILDEHPLQAHDNRADVVAVNGVLSGFEIKSSRDTLKRLPKQVEAYETVFDYCYLVTEKCCLERVRSAVPSGWGILVAHVTDDQVEIQEVRPAKINRNTSKRRLIALMWKEEIKTTLRQNGITFLSSESTFDLWQKVSKLSKAKIASHARTSLKLRFAPRLAMQQTLGDD